MILGLVHVSPEEGAGIRVWESWLRHQLQVHPELCRLQYAPYSLTGEVVASAGAVEIPYFRHRDILGVVGCVDDLPLLLVEWSETMALLAYQHRPPNADTGKVPVECLGPQGTAAAPRPWSRYFSLVPAIQLRCGTLEK